MVVISVNYCEILLENEVLIINVMKVCYLNDCYLCEHLSSFALSGGQKNLLDLGLGGEISNHNDTMNNCTFDTILCCRLRKIMVVQEKNFSI